jgi:CheY-like chemotaxis protein
MDLEQTILVVDDNELNLNVLSEILIDFDLIVSLNGETALEVVKKEPIDLILLDIMMPGLDGFEICRRLKRDPKTDKIPIIFLTAKGEAKDIRKAFELGAVDYVTKPFNAIELSSRITTHLSLRSYEKNLEQKIKDEIEKNKLNEQLVCQRSKQSDMGELLMHISHQWKQPLSEIGSINMYNITKLKMEDQIDKAEFEENFMKISQILRFMSETLSTFSNFYVPNKNSETFTIKSAVETAVKILDATFFYENIEVELVELDECEIFGNKNEYSQIILSILSNAKDMFKLRQIKEPKIVITIDSEDGRSKVTLRDNAGGIDLEKVNDIFLPFISGKESTGIGLYMAKNICEKNGGVLTAQNLDNGALFTVKI